MNKQEYVLLIDDEPEYLGFLADYFESKDLLIERALNIPESLKQLENKKYKLVIIDMNIPAPGAASELLDNHISKKYPGYKLAEICRNHGYKRHQIIAYTVHDDDALDAELAKLGCRYVLKGRPDILKSVISKSLK
jgi:CheY-like chemotaxis protein